MPAPTAAAEPPALGPTNPAEIDEVRAAALHMRVAHQVRTRTSAAGLSMRALGEAAHINQASIRRRLDGVPPGFRLDELARVAEVLDCTVSDLVGDARSPE